jgi:GT2 family glycosyltransferase
MKSSQAEENDHSERIPFFTIVIVNSDGLRDTLNCLESIFLYPPQVDFEVVLIDNCSLVPIRDAVRKAYPRVSVHTTPQKQGFSKNYNMGIRLAQGELVMILNNDTIMHANALDILLNAIRQNPTYGMVGPKLLSPNGQIQPVCARPLTTPGFFIRKQLYLDAGTPTGKRWLSNQQKKLTSRISGPVPCISGACMLTSKTILEQVGLLDEGFEFYFEDVELCHRVQEHEYEVAYIAEAKITHLGDQSLYKVREWAKKSEYLSALRYFEQYYQLTKTKKVIIWFFTVMSYFLRALYFSLVKYFTNKENFADTYWRLFKWILRNYPSNNLHFTTKSFQNR